MAKRLTAKVIGSELQKTRTEEYELNDGACPGLALRISVTGSASWTFIFRVSGEGGVNVHGKAIKGKRHRAYLGTYPEVSLEDARSRAFGYLADARRGINPKIQLAGLATAGTVSIEALSQVFMREYVDSKDLDSAFLYRNSFATHINPIIGKEIAELISREHARKVMNAARVKRPRSEGRRGAQVGGTEAARTAMRILRHMFSWAITEKKLRRTDNPCSNIANNLPKAKKGGVALSMQEARVVWRAAKNCGFPFGCHAQLMLLTGCRKDEWASAQWDWIDLEAGLMVIPAENYKSDRVHVIPLVREAVEILRSLPRPRKGTYVLSSRDGIVKIAGVAKFYKTVLHREIVAEAGETLTKRLTSHVLRRTVATRLAEILGYEGDKLVKRVLGHADSSVTALYNQYGYVREMRRALELWANELTSDSAPLPTITVDATQRSALMSVPSNQEAILN